jgi:hypothetical protein
MQSDNGAQAQHEAQANEQHSCTEGAEERVQTHEMAQASNQEILADNGDDRAQAQPDHAEVPALLAEREQPILTQQKVIDLIMHAASSTTQQHFGRPHGYNLGNQETRLHGHVEWIPEPHKDNVPGGIGFSIRTIRVSGGSRCKSQEPYGAK